MKSKYTGMLHEFRNGSRLKELARFLLAMGIGREWLFKWSFPCARCGRWTRVELADMQEMTARELKAAHDGGELLCEACKKKEVRKWEG